MLANEILSNELIDINIITNKQGELEILECEKSITQKITPELYEKDISCIDGLKLPQLKQLIKFFKNSMILPNENAFQLRKAKAAIKKIHDFGLVGNKSTIRKRLENFLIQEICAKKIQKLIRSHFVKKFIYLLGPAFKNKKICANISDFTTLEPLENIPYDDFFSYQDQKGHIYGFQLSSLIEYINRRKYREIKNPYNRDSMNYLLDNISKIYRLNYILQKKYNPKKREILKKNKIKTRNNINIQNQNIRGYNLFNTYNYNHEEVMSMIRITRAKPLSERIRNIFIEIDNLGNYTDSTWFTSLDRRGYIRFFRILKDIWIFRGQIPTHIKIKIAPLWDPFLMQTLDDINDYSLEDLQNLCLSVIEDMVYTGVDVEYRTLGALHVLSVLTIVSYSAREAMPWLYESLI